MEIRIHVDDEFIETLKRKLQTTKATEVAVDALTLLNWAVEEAKEGRVILSAKKDGTDIHRLAMPALNQVKPESS
ncbi:MAG TPA: hypothetical protein VI524_05175 [Anaerolineales bacterium]|nr:hypothetical protein [Anaerolineales bacterium]